jgi:hypothetical protein
MRSLKKFRSKAAQNVRFHHDDPSCISHDSFPGMIQDSDSEVHDPSSSHSGYTPMASSSKRQLGVKDSESNLNAAASDFAIHSEALQAFHTITAMLSLLQSTRGRDTDSIRQPKLASGTKAKEQLQVLDALASVLIRNHGIAAVTARLQADDSGDLKSEVLASFSGNTGKSLTPPTSQQGSLIQFLRKIFITQNPRDPSVTRQCVVDPETLEVTKPFKKILDPIKLLDTFLKEIW